MFSDHLMYGQVAMITASMEQHKFKTNAMLEAKRIVWRLSMRKLDHDKTILVWRKLGDTAHQRMSYCPSELEGTESEDLRTDLNAKMRLALFINKTKN